jgi:hypothetical protein
MSQAAANSKPSARESGTAVANGGWLRRWVRRRCPICGKTKCKKGMMELEGIVPMEAAKILHDL